MQLVPTKPTALCSHQAESVIVDYYAFRRKRIPVRLYARTDDLSQLCIIAGLRRFSVALTGASRFTRPRRDGCNGCDDKIGGGKVTVATVAARSEKFCSCAFSESIIK